MLITDINTAGSSSLTIVSRTREMQITLSGTWNGSTVSLEKKLSDGSWESVYSWTENAFDIVETIGPGSYRTNTTHGTSAPVLKCDVFIEDPSFIV